MSFDSSEIRRLRSQADAAHRAGDFVHAIRLQNEVVEQLRQARDLAVDERKLLALFHYSAGKQEEALEILEGLVDDAPNDVEIVENTGIILRRLGRKKEAIEALCEAHRRDPRRANVCDALAHTYSDLGNAQECQRFGRLSLRLKDADASKRPLLRQIPAARPPTFLSSSEKKNVISFSLWGNDLRYLKGALRNAAAAVDVYPGWTVRFYCDDSVPPAVVVRLKEYGAEIVLRPAPKSFFDGLLWRFEVISDPTVARFLIRDCDSVVNVKERVAVDEWLASDKWFHAMRDYSSHTEVILAGMWGGVAGVLPGVKELRENFHPTTAPTRTFDQLLLREVVWPIIRKSVLIHDSVYTGTLGSVPFPEVGGLPPGFHVGQNEAAVRKGIFIPMLGGVSAKPSKLFFLSGLDAETVGHCADLIGQLDSLAVLGVPALEDVRESLAKWGGSMIDGAAPPEKRKALTLELLASSLEVLVNSGSDNQAKRVGVIDVGGERDVLKALLSRLEAKILCVIRDPRNSVRSRAISSVAEAVEWGREWKGYLDFVASLRREYPSRVELIRYEDLAPDRVMPAIARIYQFLDVVAEIKAVSSPCLNESPKLLSKEIRATIEREAGDLLTKLRYSV